MPSTRTIQPSTPRDCASCPVTHTESTQYPAHGSRPHAASGTRSSFEVASVRPTVTILSFLPAMSASAGRKYVSTYCLTISSRSCWNAGDHDSAPPLRTQRNVPVSYTHLTLPTSDLV